MRGRLMRRKEKSFGIMWNLTVIFSSVLCLVVITDAEPARYDGFKLLRVKASHKRDLEFVKKIYDSGDDKLDFWREPRTPNQEIDIMVAPSHEEYARGLLSHDGITVHRVMDDIQGAIDEQIKINDEMDDEQIFFGNYQNLSTIDDWMMQLSEVYPDIVSTFQIATSYEKRPINCLKVGSPSPTGTVKPAIFILGGMHAREWISPATVMYMAKELIEGYAVDDDVMKALLDGLDWYILPVANVDGYVFTFESYRLWRKTRSKHRENDCRGADPNRNWDFNWGVGQFGTQSSCDDTYAGPFAFSESEVKELAEYLTDLVERQPVFAFLDFHAYSQYWMTPYGYDTVLPNNFDDQLSLALNATAAIQKINGTEYTVGNIADVIYKAAGNSVDFVHGVLGVPFCYAIELPDKGAHGFLLPPRYIIPVGRETLEAIKVIGQAGLGSQFYGNEASKVAPSLTTAWFAYACFVVLRWAAAA